MGMAGVLRFVFGKAATILTSGLTLLKASGGWKILVITLFVILPLYPYVLARDPIGLVVEVGRQIGTADKIIYDSIVIILTNTSLVDRLTALYTMTHAIIVIGWYAYTWFWVGNRFMYEDVYVFLTGSIVFLLLFIIGHMQPGTFVTPFKGIITLVKNLHLILNTNTLMNGVNNSTAAKLNLTGHYVNNQSIPTNSTLK